MDVSEDIHISDESETESWEVNEISYESPASNNAADDMELEEYKPPPSIDDIQMKDHDLVESDGESDSDVAGFDVGHNSAPERSPSVYLSKIGNEDSIVNEDSDREEIVLPVRSSSMKHQTPAKWIPRISWVTRMPASGAEFTSKDSGHVVLIPEDTIKQEEFVDESEDFDEVNEKYTTDFTIKLEKLDFIDPRNEDVVQPVIKKRLGRPRKKTRKPPFSARKSEVKSNHSREPHINKKSSERTQPSRNRVYEFRNRRQRNDAENDVNRDRRSCRAMREEPEENGLARRTRKLRSKNNKTALGSKQKNTHSVTSDIGSQQPTSTRPISSRKLPDRVSVVKQKSTGVLLRNDETVENDTCHLRKRRRRSAEVSVPTEHESDDCSTEHLSKKKQVSLCDIPQQTDGHVNGSGSNINHMKNKETNSENKPRSAVSTSHKKIKKSKLDLSNSASEPKKNFSLYRCENFEKILDVWYECLCCEQKYHLREQAREHVRGHFPDIHTS